MTWLRGHIILCVQGAATIQGQTAQNRSGMDTITFSKQLSRNDVWLTDVVPAKYLSRVT
ncbi:hypothetical protein ACWKW4_20840 [Hydrogenophaga borbori]